MKNLLQIGFGELELRAIKLNVFDINTPAIQCYESLGFFKNRIMENVYQSKDGLVWNNIEMVLERERYFKTQRNE